MTTVLEIGITDLSMPIPYLPTRWLDTVLTNEGIQQGLPLSTERTALS